MKKLEITVPGSEQAFDALNEDQREQVLSEFDTIKVAMNNFLEYMAEEVVAPILVRNPQIETLTLDPNYEYNDEGYAPSHVMPFINGEYWGEDDDLFEEIDNACAGFAHLMTQDISFDVDLLKKKYAAKHLDKELPEKPKKSSRRFKT